MSIRECNYIYSIVSPKNILGLKPLMIYTAMLIFFTAPLRAEIDGSMGGGFMSYDIEIIGLDCHRQQCGQVVIVPAGAGAPPGFTTGQEYWGLTEELFGNYNFALVPSIHTPNINDFDWQILPHRAFDLSQQILMPDIMLDKDETLYQIQTRRDGGWQNKGWMISEDGIPKQWYGINLSKPYIGGEDSIIRFRLTQPPVSRPVFILRD